MMYNRKLSGLNSSLWAHNFALTIVGSTLRVVEMGTFMADRDIGEMFINFMLSEEARSFCGVDVTNVRTEYEWERHIIVSWER